MTCDDHLPKPGSGDDRWPTWAEVAADAESWHPYPTAIKQALAVLVAERYARRLR
jgi:hypothetical protein